MIRLLSLRILVSFVCIVASLGARAELTDKELGEVDFVQYPGRALPLELSFTNSEGASARLGDLFTGVPVILVPGYFRCRMLCEGVSDGLILALQGSRRQIGTDFRVLFVSIDPNEAVSESQARKRTFLKRYGRHGAAGGCEFLTGTQPSISALAECIGYRYRYDPQTREFAHPAGFVLIRPDGTIARYFFGVSFSARELEEAISRATRMDKPSAVERLLLLCFHYNPLRSRYSALILVAVRALALTTMAWVVLLVVRSERLRLNAKSPPQTKAPRP